jgi:hypothetical protein
MSITLYIHGHAMKTAHAQRLIRFKGPAVWSKLYLIIFEEAMQLCVHIQNFFNYLELLKLYSIEPIRSYSCMTTIYIFLNNIVKEPEKMTMELFCKAHTYDLLFAYFCISE